MEMETTETAAAALNPRQSAMNRTMIISKKSARRPGLPEVSPTDFVGGKSGKNGIFVEKLLHFNSNGNAAKIAVAPQNSPTFCAEFEQILRDFSLDDGICQKILDIAKLREKRWTEVVEKCEKDKAMESQLYELKLKAANKNSEKATELFKILEENGIDIDAVLTDRFADSIRRHFQRRASTPRANESPNSVAANYNETVFKLMREKDTLSGEINSLEENYSNLFKLYEKMRLNCVNLKEVEQSLRAELDGLGRKYGALHKMYTELLVEAQKKLEDANEELRHSDKEHVQKTMALRLALKRAQIRLGSVEKALELKNKENAELHDICGQLIEAREQFEQHQHEQQHNNSSALSVADNESVKENSTAHGRHLFSQC